MFIVEGEATPSLGVDFESRLSVKCTPPKSPNGRLEEGDSGLYPVNTVHQPFQPAIRIAGAFILRRAPDL